jgi:hypothetical protein
MMEKVRLWALAGLASVAMLAGVEVVALSAVVGVWARLLFKWQSTPAL